MTNTVEVRIVGKDDASDELSDVKDKAEDLDKGFGKLSKQAKNLGMALATAFVADQAMDLAKLGAQAERVERRFTALAAEAGGAEEMLKAFQRGAGGAASKMSAMASSSKLLQMGLVGNADEMSRVVEMATRLGDQTMGVSDRVADFAAMLANQSIPRLDNFGISSGYVRQRISELQAQTEGLSRETAFMQAVMEAGGSTLEKLGPRVEDNLSSFERMEAKMADTRVELGQKLAPVMVVFADTITTIVDALSPLIDLLGAAPPQLLAMAGGMTAATVAAKSLAGAEGIKGLLSGMGALNPTAMIAVAGIGALVGAFIAYNKQLDKINAAQQEAIDTAANWSNEADEMIGAGKPVSDVMSELASRTNEATRAWNDNIVTGTALGGVFGTHNKILGVYEQTQREVNDIAIAATDSYSAYVAEVDRYNSAVTDANAKVKALTQAEYDAIAAREQMTAAFGARVFGAPEKMAEQIRSVTTAQRELNQETLEANSIYLNSVVPAVEETNNSFWEHVAAQDAAAKRAKHTERVMVDNALAMGGLAAMAGPGLDEVRAKSDAMAAAEQRAAEHGAHLAQVQRDMAAAAVEAANSFAQQAMSLKDASEQQIAQQLIGSLDAEAMGTEAFTTAVTNIGTEFGLMDEKSMALAENLPKLTQALNDGVVPAQNADEALKALVADASDGEVAFGAIVREFRQAPEPLEKTAQATQDMTTQLQAVDKAANPAAVGLGKARSAAQQLGTESEVAERRSAALANKMHELEGEYVVTTRFETIGSPPSPPQYQGGGVVPGMPSQAVPIIAHGGERIVPVGMSAGPTGPPVHNTQNTYNDTYNVTGPMAMTMAKERAYQKRRAKSQL